MHVCHLTKYYPPAAGGIETHVQTLARAQAAIGLRVSVICVDHREKGKVPVTEPDGDGVSVTRFPRRFQLAKWDCCPGLRRAIRQHRHLHEQPDLLHLHTPNPTMSLALFAARQAKPLVITHHSDVIRQRLLGRALRLIDDRLLARAKSVFATSSNYIEGSVQLQKFRDKVEVVPLGIDLQPFTQPSPAAIRFAEQIRAKYDGPRWLSVGRLVYYKGLDTAIRALTKVPGTLIVVGEGPLREQWETLARELNVNQRIAWLGKVDGDRLVGLYHSATALWFPSTVHSEAFGLVQVEAMACGCPVVNTSIPNSGVSWVSVHGESGLTVAPNSFAEFADAAAQLHHDPELRQRFSITAVRRAQTLFDHHSMARRITSSYASAVQLSGHLSS
ncbi:MAG: glycosyltransferase [Pirellulales bacterium]